MRCISLHLQQVSNFKCRHSFQDDFIFIFYHKSATTFTGKQELNVFWNDQECAFKTFFKTLNIHLTIFFVVGRISFVKKIRIKVYFVKTFLCYRFCDLLTPLFLLLTDQKLIHKYSLICLSPHKSKIAGNNVIKNTPRHFKYCRCRLFTAVCRRCRLPGPCPTGVRPIRRGISNIEKLPPGPTTSQGSMNVYCKL
jgi:hypothetical protein